jgi:cell division protein FtsL
MVTQQQRSKRGRSKQNLQMMSQRITRMEEEVYQTMVVMGASLGKMLNYRQLR